MNSGSKRSSRTCRGEQTSNPRPLSQLEGKRCLFHWATGPAANSTRGSAPQNVMPSQSYPPGQQKAQATETTLENIEKPRPRSKKRASHLQQRDKAKHRKLAQRNNKYKQHQESREITIATNTSMFLSPLTQAKQTQTSSSDTFPLEPTRANQKKYKNALGKNNKLACHVYHAGRQAQRFRAVPVFRQRCAVHPRHRLGRLRQVPLGAAGAGPPILRSKGNLSVRPVDKIHFAPLGNHG